MEEIREAKNEYFRNRYQEHKEDYKKTQNTYWYNYAVKVLGKEDITDEDVKKCKNQYYKEYRNKNKSIIQKNSNNFWAKQI